MKKWVQAARLFVIAASVLPAVLGSLLALSEKGRFAPLLFGLTLLGVAFIHLGANLINDYFDHLTGADENNSEGVFPFSGGSRVIQEGTIPPARVLKASILCYLLAAMIGAYLFTVSGVWVLVIGLFGILSSILYVSPKFSLLNMGIGELVVGLDFGVLTVAGAYYVQTGTFSLSSLMASLPIAIIIALILIVNEFPDYNGDRISGKMTLVVRLGRKKASYVVTMLLALTVLSIIINAAFGFTNLWSLLGLAAIPFVVNAAVVALKHYDNVNRMLPANISIINSHIFFNAYLAVSCLFFGKYLILGYCLAGAVFLYQLFTMKQIGILKIQKAT